MNDINSGFNDPELKQLYPDEVLEKYKAGGYQTMPETEVVGNEAAVNVATINTVLPSEMVHSYWNHRQMFEDAHRDQWSRPWNVAARCGIDIWRSIKYYAGCGKTAENMPKGRYHGPCIIIGSGCSLDDALPLLHKWRGGLICSSSHAATLMYWGAAPSHVVNFDMRTHEREYDFPHDYRKTVMITWPGIHPAVNARWQGRQYYYRVYDPAVNFYAYTLPGGYNWITTQLQPMGHSVAMQMSAATWMGYSPLILVGTDFCYTDKTRFDAWWWRKHGLRRRWEFSPAGETEDMRESNILINTAGGRVSDWMLLHYRRTTVVTSWLDNAAIYDTTDGTLNGLYPRADIRNVIETQGRMLTTHAQTRDRLEPWLATEATYFVPMLDGCKLVTAHNDIVLEGTLHMLKKYDEEIDIPAQMERFRELRKDGEERRADGQYGKAGLRE